ncbi:hypothetical protein NP233_g3293 [Leucocoprinus birnbaumii]|uniref:Uncharacterized protein n=1 Tax=Leucocoprinus birnbaumii TaxID=56174 RepID=A0AAD5YWJ6_9AGAR|nr:hypothetical protein NP233_g3293 [Leucocoprinus birnbaumii]
MGLSDDAFKFFPTIAYQLALRFPSYESLLRHKFRRNTSLLSKCLETQLHELIVDPFRQLDPYNLQIGNRRLSFVGEPDRCQDSRGRLEILRLIEESKRELPFRWVIFGSLRLAGQLVEPTVISVESSQLFSGSYKG